MDGILSVNAAGQYLGLSPWTIRDWISKGRLTRIKIGARTFVRQTELDMQIHVETTAEAAVRNSRRERQIIDYKLRQRGERADDDE